MLNAERVANGTHRSPWKQTALWVLLLSAGVAYLYPSITNPLNPYDEGLVAVYAMAILDGKLPYRDFWTLYSPGQYYATAAVFTIFGPSIMALRLWDIVLRSLLALAAHMLASRLSNRWLGLLSWAVVLIWFEAPRIGFGLTFGWPVVPALVCFLFGIAATMQSFVNPRWLYVAGALTGLGALFRQDFALYAVTAQSVAVFSYFYSGLNRSKDRFLRVLASARKLLPFIAAFMAVTVPAALYFLFNAPLNDLIQDLITYPVSIYPSQRDLPYPPLGFDSFPFYFFFLVFALSSYLVYRMATRPANEMTRTWACGVTSVVLFGLLGFNQARVRSDLLHIAVSLVAAVILLPALIVGFRVLYRRSVLPVAAMVGAVACLLCFGPLSAYFAAFPKPKVNDSLLPRAQGMPVEEGQLRVIEYLKQRTNPGDLIYSGVGRHDRIFANDVMIYFLSELRPATRYVDLNPGQATTQSAQREMCNDLEIHSVEYVVIWKGVDGVSEPNESAKSSGVTLLDTCIASRYSAVYSAGQYLVLQRNR